MVSDGIRENSIGDRIRFLRIINSITQRQLAESVGVSQKAIASFENGHSTPSEDTRFAIQEFFGVPVKSLKFSPRAMMEKSIEAMRRSVQEKRDDGKVTPSVGAVMIAPGGLLETSYRGELRFGDHAEFSLLERKKRGERLDGAILFSTLEPCAPGSRNHPKLGCAERIVLARISEVWVGIEDPDPTVDRKGIKYLEENGITVHMFDPDLQDQIREFNDQFLKQARERADEEEASKAVTLSALENSHLESAFDDFSQEALDTYRELAGISEAVSSEGFARRLLRSELLKREDSRSVPSGFGLILFGKEPRTVYQQAGLLATVTYPNGEDETRTFDEPLVLIPGLVEEWVKSVLPMSIDRNTMVRGEKESFPFELIREAVVNALVHRDYDIEQAKCQLEITPTTVTIRSPGEPVSPITLEQLQQFNAPMLSRNPKLHLVLSQMKMSEERGFGMKTWKTIPEKYGLPRPMYRWDDPYLVLTFYRSPESATDSLSENVKEQLSDSELRGYQWLTKQDLVTRKQYQEAMGIGPRAGGLQLKKFIELGIAKKTGVGRATRYSAQ